MEVVNIRAIEQRQNVRTNILSLWLRPLAISSALSNSQLPLRHPLILHLVLDKYQVLPRMQSSVTAVSPDIVETY